ncbi:MAG: DMT family transporter [Marinobacter sp.]|uniref:DMT family transporter n=1 Tax=Marinobacter sp. TaxID=50741 RepID=UPI00299F1C1A|nr:DMT family transporter [Marinobacter sp.]MDX1635705.1 DMT family transporter [Marinobacter sp.]
MNTTSEDTIWIRLMPATFVLLWSTGFIGAKFGLPYAEPFTLLFYRMLLSLLCLGLLALAISARWPASWRQAGHLAVTGLLVHGAYLGGVFTAIEAGMPAGLTALVVGLQPLLTGVLTVLVLKEPVSGRVWLGLLLGLVGVILVLGEKLAPESGGLFDGFPLWAVLAAVAALFGIAMGTLYQKRFCGATDLVSGAFIQYCAAAVLFGALSFTIETREVQWTPQLMFALAWLVLVLSLGAIGLLLALIRRGASAQVASLFYLVTPVTALEAWLLFDERLGLLALVGTAVAVSGVYLVITPGRRRQPA